MSENPSSYGLTPYICIIETQTLVVIFLSWLLSRPSQGPLSSVSSVLQRLTN